MKQKTKFKQTEIGMIPEDWEEKKLGDSIELKYGKGLPKSQRKKGKILVYGSNGIIGSHNEFFVNFPSIIIGRKGSVGEVLFSDKPCWPIDTTYFITQNESKLNLIFLYYKLLTLKLNRMNSHAAVPGLNREDIYRLKTNIPRSLPEQSAIAHILSTLDEKIELLQKQNKTLEEIGQAIFKKWFIDNPEKEGWEVSTIGKELKTILGGTPSRIKSEYWNGNINWINSGKVNEFRIIEPSEKITEEGLKKSATSLLPKGTVVLAITGATLGQVSKLEIDSCANQSVVGVLENEKLSSPYIYYWIKNRIYDIIGRQTGGAQQHINKGNIDAYSLLIPDKKTLKEFNKVIEPTFSKISNNCFNIQTLSQIRDSLLPKLMSGKIRVPVE